MGKSFRKNPIIGNCGSGSGGGSEKDDKSGNNRRLRRKLKIKLHIATEDDYDSDVLPELDDVSNPWDASKDGKSRFDKIKYPELMRK